MKEQSSLSDEFIYDSYIKALRFNLTLTLSTFGAIIALFNLSDVPIEINTPIFFTGMFLLFSVVLSVLGHLRLIRQVIEKRPIEKIDKNIILISFWCFYVFGVMSAIYSLAKVAAQS